MTKPAICLSHLNEVTIAIDTWRMCVSLPAQPGGTGITLELNGRGDDGQDYYNLQLCPAEDEAFVRCHRSSPRNGLGLIPKHGSDGYVIATIDQINACCAGLAVHDAPYLALELEDLPSGERAIIAFRYYSQTLR